MYLACGNCNKKVEDRGNETYEYDIRMYKKELEIFLMSFNYYRCPKCGPTTKCNWRFLLKAFIADETEHQVRIFPPYQNGFSLINVIFVN